MEEVKLSVIVITYNHEQYIRQALDSILMQKVNFTYEILIGDDASHDATQQILKEYKDKYPEKIRLKLWKKNVGATKNDYYLKMNAKGEYIAQLEGDDYWTDADKLQIQVDFLEKNRQYIGCTHEFVTVDQYGNVKKKLQSYDVLAEWLCENREYSISDVNKWTMPGHTGTYVYRNFFHDIDFSILYKAHRYVGDRTMSMLLAAQGKVYRLDREMSAYRFVKKDKATNWFSLEGSNQYILYDFFFYVRRLERYAKQEFGITLDIKKEKHHDFLGQLSVFCYKPTLAMLRCIMRMLINSGNPAEYLFLGITRLPYLFYRATVMNAVQQTQKCEDYRTENKQLKKSTWREAKKALQGKKLVLFGAGANCKSFLRKYYYKYHPLFIVDNDRQKWESAFQGVIVRSPKELRKYNKNEIVVFITISEYTEEIAAQLEEMGINNYYAFPLMEYKKPYYWLYRIVEYLK